MGIHSNYIIGCIARVALAASARGLLIGVLGLVVLSTGCQDGSLSKTLGSFGAAKFLGLTKDEPPVFLPMPAIRLKPNETQTISLAVDRKGNEGPIKVSLEGLPPGLDGTVREISAGSSSTEATLSADPSLGDEDLVATMTLTATVGNHVARIGAPIHVPRVPRPSLSIEEPIVLQPGKQAVIAIPVLRNGWEAEIPLKLEDCPKMLAVTAGTVPVDETSTQVAIAVDSDATEGPTSFSLSWDSYGRTMTVEVPIVIEQAPYVIAAPIAVALRPGESRTVPVRIRRSAYRGPVSLSLTGLPHGVQASSGTLASEADEGTVAIKADASTQGEYAVATIEASGGHITADGLFVIRVQDEIPPSDLPATLVTALSGLARPRPGGIEARFSEAAKESLDRFYGTTPASKPAIEDGLRWLASTQLEDGTWQSGSVTRRQPDGFGQQQPRSDVWNDREGHTALAVLPFLAEGIGHDPERIHQQEHAEYADVVKKALFHLARAQVTAAGAESGRVGSTLQAQIFSLTAFAEAAALTENIELKRRAKKAADYLIEQQSRNGGWGENGDTNALDTAQALVALRVARGCRIGSISSAALRRGEKFLASCSAGTAPNNLSMYALTPGGLPDAEASAAGFLAMLYADPRPSPDLLAGCNFLVKEAPAFRAMQTSHSGIFLLFATEVLQNLEGEQFDRWNAMVRTFLTAHQLHHGDQLGSWDPRSFGAETDAVQTSSLAILCLQSNYRYLPLFRTANGGREENSGGSSDQPPNEPDGN